MRSTHRIVVAVALAVAAAAGTAAATRTVHLGADTRDATPISASALAAQKAKLAAADRSIDRALAARPPALPRVPRFEPLGEPSRAAPGGDARGADDLPGGRRPTPVTTRPPRTRGRTAPRPTRRATTPVPTGGARAGRARTTTARTTTRPRGEDDDGGEDHADDHEDGGDSEHARRPEPEHHDD